MTKFRQVSTFGIITLLFALIISNCTKKVEKDALVERNGLMYEINSDEPFSGEVVDDYSATPFENGKRNGVKKDWYKNGQPKVEASYKSDQLDGEYKEWNKKLPQPQWDDLINQFKNDQIRWRLEDWYKNGQPKVEANYNSGQLDSIYREWHPEGHLAIEAEYNSGKVNGLYKAWNNSGYLISREIYEKGEKARPFTKSPLSDRSPETMTDIDNNIYNTVKIGAQIWMAENLKVTRYRDGSEIPFLESAEDWKNMNSGAYSYYFERSNGEFYGALYNWYAVHDRRKIAPRGWHVPTYRELRELKRELELEGNAGSMLAGYLDMWRPGEIGSLGFGASGFNALPGGYANSSDYGGYDDMDWGARIWSASSANGDSSPPSDEAVHIKLFNMSPNLYLSSTKKTDGLSVRCLKD